MAYAINLERVTATISSGGSLSAAVPLGAATLVGISMPAAWDTAGLTFQASVDGTTFQDVQTTSAELSMTAAASKYIAVDPAVWRGVNLLKVRSGTSGTPVNQTADRTITLVLRMVS